MTKTEKYLPFILAFGFPAISFINNNGGLPEVAWISIIGSYMALMLFLLLIWYFNQYIFRRIPQGKKKPLMIAVLNVVVIAASVPVIQIVVQENIGTAVRVGLWTTVLRMGMAAAIITMIQHALRVSKQRQVLQLEKSVLESEKLKAELNAMKQQINPHFLFNSLNTLIDLIEDNQEKAVEFVRSFSNLYRIVLQSTRHNLIPLKDELAFLNYYWELLKMRFNDTVQLNIQLPEEMLDYHIPPLSLQLLVENAVKHNQFSRNKPLVLEILSDDDTIQVKNNLNPKIYKEHESGFGLNNLQKRFTSLIGPIQIEKDDDTFIVNLPVQSPAHSAQLT